MKDLHSLGLRRVGNKLEVMDQTLLPSQEKWLEVNSSEEMISIIRRLAVRGAPLIGVAAALALAQFSQREKNPEALKKAAEDLRAARPTAVNLMNCMDRMLTALVEKGPEGLEAEAVRIFEEDQALCRAMGERGAAFIAEGDGVLTHCNTGGLATAGIGTALGVIRTAHEQGKRIHVFVDETRPLLQGARLTAWELGKLGIPYTLICDNMAASLMREGRVHKIFVGADRIACNGDAANKIGTYGLAVIANFHTIPFYVVAPSTTLDPDCKQGSFIPIEQRESEEVRAGKAPKDCAVWNPAFDVTPRELISQIILEDRLM